ncbi:hypothetical protein N6H14_10815 [Paenibacillus sp. CC-CFT747]|nr:hypothetical protein N6H14_10815 [Paenibacillus sp. CC-CFT747]
MPQGLQLADLTHLAPELTLVISAIVISLLDMFLPRTVSRTLLGWLSLAGVLISAVFVIGQLNPAEPVSSSGKASGWTTSEACLSWCCSPVRPWSSS